MENLSYSNLLFPKAAFTQSVALLILEAMASVAARQTFNLKPVKISPLRFLPNSHALFAANKRTVQFLVFGICSEDFCKRNVIVVPKVSSNANSLIDDDDDGVSLGTLKLPANTDLARFESLLFQWANSLCQGANLPMPVPLKVDKIPGGARLGFITIGDGETEVLVYIDCLVFPGTQSSGPLFRAIRNGPMKNQMPPGEPRIMRSLLDALKKSIEIARL